jgi:hypothetical protein
VKAWANSSIPQFCRHPEAIENAFLRYWKKSKSGDGRSTAIKDTPDQYCKNTNKEKEHA